MTGISGGAEAKGTHLLARSAWRLQHCVLSLESSASFCCSDRFAASILSWSLRDCCAWREQQPRCFRGPAEAPQEDRGDGAVAGAMLC